MGKDVAYSREEVIERELRVIFGEYDIGELGRSRDEFLELRLASDDFEEVEDKVIDNILKNTSITEEAKEFPDIVKTVIYGYYLGLHFTEYYLSSGDFEELSGEPFKEVWAKLDTEDIVTIIGMYMFLGDTGTLMYGIYVLLAQVARNGNGK